MSVRDEIRDFLLSRRARLSPERAGLPRLGERRVAGLRREEVAQLAGVSVEYYTRLERGNARGYSDDVVGAIARALQLDDAEREHLFDLVHTANARAPKPARATKSAIGPGLQRVLDAMATIPAYIWNSRLDIVATNRLGRALFAPMFGTGQPNQAAFLFLDPSAPAFFPDWELLAHDAVAVLRAATPRDEHLKALIDQLRTNITFQDLWLAYDVSRRRTGLKRFHHPVAGPLTLTFESMTLPTHPGLRLSAGTAEPGSPSEQALQFLANWTTTLTREGPR
ncbi:helix-turn-helix transcriptional regulator [Actinoplanes sp. HUAS TT8]|uniref:helix-turn-helix transcriptional regulator n=1 Tax=Actinoplanes sp. HUAS TT8 TaxID=3447453 RepID=UPI003F521DDA